MIFVARKGNVILTALMVIVLLGVVTACFDLFSRTTSGNLDYRVFVSGIGTIEGKWSGKTGIAVIGLETRPAPGAGLELKVIDLLVANKSSERMLFNSDICLIDKTGRRFQLKAKGQPEVSINSGALSQGTVIISVPKGIPDQDWLIEVKGGNLNEAVFLPLRIQKASDINPQ